MVYNLTTFIDGNETFTFLGFVQSINDNILSHSLGALLLIGICAVILTSMIYLTNDFLKSASITSFIAFVLSLQLVALNLLSPFAIYITLIASAIFIALMWKND